MKVSYPLCKQQTGAFIIEFALLSTFLGLLFLFSIDAAIKLSVKGKLDRLSHSIVSIVKERTELYGGRFNINESGRKEATQLFNIAKGSLQRTIGAYNDTSNIQFGMLIEEAVDLNNNRKFDTTEYNSYHLSDNGQHCSPDKMLADLETDNALKLSVVTSWNNLSPLYRVTFCYNTQDYTSAILGSEFTTVQSSSFSVGR